jgi:hypothetical protein
VYAHKTAAFARFLGILAYFRAILGYFPVVLTGFWCHFVVVGRLNCCRTNDFDLHFVVGTCTPDADFWVAPA